MPNMRHHFNALLTRINPTDTRVELVSRRTNELRDWLREHDYETAAPHTRLSGSYSRSTATEGIPDVDVLLFLHKPELERTPNSILIELNQVLKDYPGGTSNTTAQRRSVRIELASDVICLDIVPAVVPEGLERPLRIPDRPQKEWIQSDPLGYAGRLTAINQAHGGKLVPLIKLLKAWRDEQMKRRRPKSYVLEVMLLYAVEDGTLVLCDRSVAENVRDVFVHITDKYRDLMENGTGVPRISDPQVGGMYITGGWERSHFETFMRRASEARTAAENAVAAKNDAAASEEWKRVFGSRWPSDDDVRAAIRAEARSVQPGSTSVSKTGRVLGGVGTVLAPATRFHGSE